MVGGREAVELEAQIPHRLGPDHTARIDQERTTHHLADASVVEGRELGPIGGDDQRVRTLGRTGGRTRYVEPALGKTMERPVRSRVEGHDLGTQIAKLTGERQRGRIT